jgi:hypothetical protein
MKTFRVWTPKAGAYAASAATSSSADTPIGRVCFFMPLTDRPKDTAFPQPDGTRRDSSQATIAVNTKMRRVGQVRATIAGDAGLGVLFRLRTGRVSAPGELLVYNQAGGREAAIRVEAQYVNAGRH